MRGLALLLVLAAAAAGRAETYDIGADFAQPGAWSRAGDAFVAEHGANGFRFLEKGRADAARAPRSGDVAFHGLEVYETRLWFATSGVARIELSLYNRGDADRPLAPADLGEKLAAVRKLLVADGAKPPRVETQNLGGGVQQCRQTWRAPRPAQLVWRGRKGAGGRVDADFVRVTLLPPGGGPADVAKAFEDRARAQGKTAIRENVVRVSAQTAEEGRTKDGDVFVDNVPMVDQGDKGYCAVATCERVLRYYGLAVDEHELGASAGSTASGGTSLQAMYETVSALAKRHGLATHLVYGELDKGVGGRIDDLEKQVADYNKAAKKLRRPEIARSQYVRGTLWDAAAAQAAMEPDVLKAMKLKLPAFRVFQKALHDQVNAGIPLVWSVTLGLFPEPDIPQAAGGHMRLIIGYNDKAKEIVYTDSWGAGHEYKRMPLAAAWTISRAVLFIKPNRK